MKLSVSVPDQLWESARSKGADLSPSRLVQRALELWAGRDDAGFSLDPPSEASDLLDSAVARFAELARDEFERGYLAGVTLAPHLDWWDLQDLHDRRFDVQVWARLCGDYMDPNEYAPTEEHKATFNRIVDALGGMTGYPGTEVNGPRTAPYLRGFVKAMRDLWDRVNEGTTSGTESAEEVALRE
jgi:hypothetical protein